MTNLLKHTRRPDISFHANGRIRISANVVRTLAINPGDAINIAMRDGEYFLHVIPASSGIGRHQGQCYPTKRGGHNFAVSSVRLCRSFFAALGINSRRVAFAVGEAINSYGTTYLPIITRNPL